MRLDRLAPDNLPGREIADDNADRSRVEAAGQQVDDLSLPVLLPVIKDNGQMISGPAGISTYLKDLEKIPQLLAGFCSSLKRGEEFKVQI